MQTNYADTILNIAITGAMVRIDFGTVTPVTNPDGTQQGRVTQTQQLVMPLDGFVRSFGIQEQVVKKLLADGVLQSQPAGTPAVAAPESVQATATPQPTSQAAALSSGDSGQSSEHERPRKRPSNH
jgi:hypothetical protein